MKRKYYRNRRRNVNKRQRISNLKEEYGEKANYKIKKNYEKTSLEPSIFIKHIVPLVVI